MSNAVTTNKKGGVVCQSPHNWPTEEPEPEWGLRPLPGSSRLCLQRPGAQPAERGCPTLWAFPPVALVWAPGGLWPKLCKLEASLKAGVLP